MKSPYPLIEDRVDDLVAYMHERESIRLKKEEGRPKPWTTDPILRDNRFTNVIRENDRTTRWLRENWTKPHYGENPVTEFLNCAIFRWFGTITFGKILGYQEIVDMDHVNEIAREARQKGNSIFTRAYVITNGGISGPKEDVVCEHYLSALQKAAPRLVKLAMDTRSWQKVATEMRKVPGHGGSGFMTKEILQDAMRTSMFIEGIDDRYTWSPMGPGARQGMNRLRGREADKKMSEIIYLEELRELFEVLKGRLKPHMPQPGVDLDLHDIQFSLCEIDKYLRVQSGEGRMKSRYEGRR